jgi:outer membrane scaffolding protein for murein synthesis (MipA/OmpV family)
MTQTRFALSVVLGAALSAAAADAQEPATGWTVAVGGGAIAAPSYPGSGSSRVIPVPFLDVRYENRFFASPLGTGMNFVAERQLRLGVSVAPDLGRGADSVRGLAGIGPAADVKLFAVVGAGPVGILADVRHQLGGADGTLVDAGMTTALPVLPGLLVSATGLVTWADRQYMRSYFGSGVGSFAAGEGLRDASLSLMAFYRFDEHWGAQALARASLLLGDAAASPVTERRLQPAFGGFLVYKL